jgi:hypothetical protein
MTTVHKLRLLASFCPRLDLEALLRLSWWFDAQTSVIVPVSVPSNLHTCVCASYCETMKASCGVSIALYVYPRKGILLQVFVQPPKDKRCFRQRTSTEQVRLIDLACNIPLQNFTISKLYAFSFRTQNLSAFFILQKLHHVQASLLSFRRCCRKWGSTSTT